MKQKLGKTKRILMWASEVPIFMAQIPSLVAQSALKYIFQGPQNHNFTLSTLQMSPVEEGIPFHTYPYPHM